MGFDYIIFPEENRKEITPRDNTVFVSNIFELESWVRELASPQKHIKHWLSAGGIEPCKKDFYNLFLNYNFNVVKDWKTHTSALSNDLALKKLNKLFENYCHFLTDPRNNNHQLVDYLLLKNICPPDEFLALLPNLLSNNTDKNVSSIVYKEIIDTVETQSYDFTIARSKLNKESFIKYIIAQNNLRKRFPQLLGFYFNNPEELILLLSQINDLTEKEKKLEDKIFKSLPQNNDDEIMSYAFNILETNDLYEYDSKAEKPVISKKILYILRSRQNYIQKNAYIKVDLLEKYLEKVLSTMQRLEPAEKEILLTAFLHKKDCYNKNTIKNILNKFALRRLKKVMFNENSKEKNLQPNLKSKINYAKSAITELIPTNCCSLTLNYRQPALTDILVLSETNKLDNVLKQIERKLNTFTKSYNQSMFWFIAEAVSYWIGRRTKNLVDYGLKSNIFGLPAKIGNFTKNNPHNCKKCILKEIINHSNAQIRQLMWLYFLQNDCKNCLKPELTNFLAKQHNKLLEQNDKNTSKSECEIKFISALLDLNNFNSDFETSATNALNNIKAGQPVQLRRTEELLFPLYLMLKKNISPFNLTGFGSILNNSRFITEFIRLFCMNNPNSELFIPIRNISDIEKQILTTLSIFQLSSNKELLKIYILNNINDLPNMLIALKILHE